VKEIQQERIQTPSNKRGWVWQ